MRGAFILSAGLLYALPGLAQTPPPFDLWRPSGERLILDCPPGYRCQVNIDAPGIAQRLLRDGNGRRYVQLIVHGQSAGGAFSTESFIDLDPTRDGIALKQRLDQGDPRAGDLSLVALVRSGWAIDPTQPALDLSQRLTATHSGVTLNDRFRQRTYRPAGSQGNEQRGLRLELEQRLDDTNMITGSPALGRDAHGFVLRRVGGDPLPQGGSVTLPGGMGMLRDRGGTLSWQAGDTVQAVWVGQICEGCDYLYQLGGGVATGPNTTVVFSYQAFDNLADIAGPITSFSVSRSDPFTWPDPPFGPVPTLQ